MVRVSKEQKAKIRNQIIQVSRKRFIQEGYDNTRTKDIAQEVGIAEGTIFNYFDSKANIFLEAIAEGRIVSIAEKDSINYKADIIDIVYDYTYHTLKGLALLPKKIVKELLSAGVSIAKKNPGVIKKIAQIDYNFIDRLEALFQELIDIKRVRDCDARIAAETVYSIVMTEIILYIYEDDITKEIMLEKIKTKIKFILQKYIF
ncbi:MAG: TetR/AcrR family transcriptional regulator [Clostridiales bacterium]|nr:TetR/AcrR family transcriptional regulator [Clostridiales bacterium]